MKRNIFRILMASLVFILFNCKQKTDAFVEIGNNTEIDDRIRILESQFKQASLTLGSLEEKSFPTVVTATGEINVPPENRAVVSATMGGYIKSTPFLVGDKVRKGQKLVTIENPEFITLQQEYMEINEQLTYLKSEYDRQTTMKAENITSQKSYLKAESNYKTAIARFTGLEKQLRMLNISHENVLSGSISTVTSIFAPISGHITQVHVIQGAYVSPATEILEIINNDHLHLELSVFEKDIMSIKKGQHIDFRIPESSTATFKAEVLLVGTSIEPNKTIKIHAHLEDKSDQNFLTGMFVDAKIYTNSYVAEAIPNEAIVELNEKNYILVLDEKQKDTYYFKPLEVIVIESYNEFSIIEADWNLNLETPIVTKGAFTLWGE